MRACEGSVFGSAREITVRLSAFELGPFALIFRRFGIAAAHALVGLEVAGSMG